MSIASGVLSNELLGSAEKLYRYMVKSHWTGTALRGPDPGIRFNTRVGRFVKSYLSWMHWSDDLVYMQGQAYWIFANWQLFDITGDESAKSIAIACAENLVALQTPGGYWDYPNPEWAGRIATVEGAFATLGMLDCFARTRDDKFLSAADRWFEYMLNGVGFRKQEDQSMWAVNYFSFENDDFGGVPNNSTMVLWMLARMFELSGDPKYLEPCQKMVNWLRHVQLPSGELPYQLRRTAADHRIHFLCYQYNAFEFMDLVSYYKITGDADIQPVIRRLAEYLSGGLTDEGNGRFDCHKETPDVLYYTVAIARAISLANELGLADCSAIVDRAFRGALDKQKSNGHFEYHSRKNYKLIADRRSYPRYLSMILHHLLLEGQQRMGSI